jgi:hypothetical protein
MEDGKGKGRMEDGRGEREDGRWRMEGGNGVGSGDE